MDTTNYEEGFQDGLMYNQEHYVSYEELMESFDKFLDLINSQNRILKYVFNHFNHIGITNEELKTKKDKQENEKKIKDMIFLSFQETLKKEQDNGQEKTNQISGK